MNFKECRTNAGIKQKDAAQMLGITQGALSNYERETREPPVELLPSMAKAYSCTVDELLGMTELKLNRIERKQEESSISDTVLIELIAEYNKMDSSGRMFILSIANRINFFFGRDN